MTLLNQIASSKRLSKWEVRPIDMALFVCLVLGFAYIASGLLAQAYAYFAGKALEGESLPFLIVSGFGLQIGCLLAWAMFRLIVPFENRNIPMSSAASALWGAGGFVSAYLAIVPLMLIWRAVLEVFNFEYDFQLPVLLVQEGGSPWEIALMSVLVVVGAPIGEELVYRGALYRYLHRRLSPSYSIALASALFALMHFNLYSFVPLFVLSVGLCLVYRITGNLVSSIVMHGCFNAMNLILMLTVGPSEL